jgi:hypothetical protein
MSRLIGDTQATDAKSRLVGIRLADLTLRLRNNWVEMFGDADSATIILAVVAIVSERLMRVELDPEYESLKTPMPVTALANCNVSSIAAATGLNRETTRRKVAHLVKTGLLVRQGASIRLAPGFTQQKAAARLVQAQVDELRKIANDLLRMGVLSVES